MHIILNLVPGKRLSCAYRTQYCAITRSRYNNGPARGQDYQTPLVVCVIKMLGDVFRIRRLWQSSLMMTAFIAM